MRVAFYAPMKPPDDPRPSGDRRMAGLLRAALARAGHDSEVMSRLRSREASGDPARQAALRAAGETEAARILADLRSRPPAARPAAWLTYHLYYKAPDWIGPAVCRALGLPYLVAEASLAPKRAGGPWDLGHRAVLDALSLARAVVTLNPADAECLPAGVRVEPLAPFLDAAPYRAAAAARARHRAALAAGLSLDLEAPWLLAVGMMRPGDKLASYRLLAEALAMLPRRPWHLLIVGDGPARPEVEAAFAALPAVRLRWLGARPEGELPRLYAACDLLVWPAVNEAWGMALLEAQAAGLPAVAGRFGGVPAVVEDGASGLLTRPGDAAAFGAAVAALLDDPERRARLARGAAERIARDHDLPAAAGRLDAILQAAIGGAGRPARAGAAP